MENEKCKWVECKFTQNLNQLELRETFKMTQNRLHQIDYIKYMCENEK